MTSSTTSSPARYAGLDGLRALAVALVVLSHLFPPWVRGGFIGVDVFFVLSGFLITTLLLGEHATTGRVDLGSFWRRRARRLLPALAVVVTVCATAAWLIGGDVLVRLGEQVVGAATFSYNWVSIAGGSGYFSAATPELFRNFWSLAVEEQFYLVWPLVFPLFLLIPRAWGRAALALVLALVSAAWMVTLVGGGGDPTRAYFGTDTHAFGILIGIALAFVLQRVLASGGLTAAGPLPGSAPRTAARIRTVTRTRTATGAAGALALLGIGAISLLPPTDSALTFPGAVLAASVLTAVAITASVWPSSAFGAAIDARPLRWTGDRSYGIYLWHWPLLVLLMAGVRRTGPEAGVPVWIGLLALALTLACAELSYRLVETPVRRHGFRGSFARVGRRLFGSPTARVRALAGIAASVVLLGGTSAAIAAAPDVSSAQSAVQAGSAALRNQADAAAHDADGSAPGGSTRDGSARDGFAPDGSALEGSALDGSALEDSAADGSAPDGSAPDGSALDGSALEGSALEGSPGGSAPDSSARDGSAAPAPANARPVLSPTPVGGVEITAVGDSVMLASVPGLLERLPGVQIDAAVSRSSWAGPGILQSLADAGQLRRYVVLALGTNGPLDADAMEQIAQICGPDRHLVLVNAFAPRDWIAGVNADLVAFAAAHPGVVVADWAGTVAGRTDLLAEDQIHPGEEGGELFARVVADAVDRIELSRAIAQHEVELRAFRRLHAEMRVPE